MESFVAGATGPDAALRASGRDAGRVSSFRFCAVGSICEAGRDCCALRRHSRCSVVTQLRHANVYGHVEVGQQVRPLNVTQVGEGNVVGVIQVGRSPTASVSQTGRVNAAFVGQLENTPIPLGVPQMP